MSHWLIICGVVLVAAVCSGPCCTRPALPGCPGIIERENFRFYFPIVNAKAESSIKTLKVEAVYRWRESRPVDDREARRRRENIVRPVGAEGQQRASDSVQRDRVGWEAARRRRLQDLRFSPKTA